MTAHETDQDAIHRVVRDYVEGMVFADEHRLRRAFHPQSRIIGHFQGELEWLSVDDFAGAILDAGPVLAEDETPVWTIQALDITGDAASAKVVDDYADMCFTDFLSLLKIGGRWSIINKLYYLHE
ncbi:MULTISPECIES: nuclear transport factor 2 family protein [unclassified Pseudomonas]|uniref:nuclear transport factor 2 family protein n=1 Tax=unclassified Pseudomonas TaxID=196821 RepID=UPI00129E15A7|nr:MULTISPECIES: nuclear transport factor 2 family protein [unclassified Pseudomonas]MDH4651841.1 nuclear transport factor 2 family protein [Pseudomonas sp. BN606]MRK21722.1 nuclear transport factor 2 family protein [Pseudomonas sp. JG-B]